MIKYALVIYFVLSILSIPISAQVPKPEEILGFKPGEDYKIADYSQTTSYFQQVAKSSKRVKIQQIGESTMGKPMWVMIISSEKNLRKIDQWKSMSGKIARATIGEDEARRISKQGKVVVWIDAGIHATERAGAQMVPEFLYRLVTEETDEMNNIRENVIILLCPNLNPDGQDIVADWYKKQLGTPWETTSPPVLYQKYVGHDNNRDWFMNNMSETKNVSNIFYREWYPQIVHNHHQTSPSWARIFIPPFRSPVNPNIHPGVTTGVSLVGTAMANYFAMKKMPGVISGTNFSMWWNGGVRTTPYYHNQIGILTETAHSTPTPRFYPPDSIPGSIAGTASNGTEVFYPYPWKGGESHFRDAVEYMINASMGILNLAADRREEFLYNMYKMGRDAIETPLGKGAFAYVIPEDQWDKGEMINLVNILFQGGVDIHQANADFDVGDQSFIRGDFIVYGSQAFRPYLTDLLEKQSYPDQYRYPGGPPVPPYDLAGWTLPMQMGIDVHRIDTSFVASSMKLQAEYTGPGGIIPDNPNWGYLLSNKENRSALAINRLLENDQKVFIAFENDKEVHSGYFLIEKSERSQSLIKNIAEETGLSFIGLSEKPTTTMKLLEPIKIGIYKSWIANIDEGWTRWVLEQFEFDIDTLHNEDIVTGNLAVYDAIIIPSQSSSRILNGYSEGFMPPKFVGGLALKGTIALQEYAQNGGVLIAFDQACDYLINQFGLPVRDVTNGVSSNSFFIPGSLVRIIVDTTRQLGFGMKGETAASFARSSAFKRVLKNNKGEGGTENIQMPPEPEIETVVKYADKDILMSGWAKGEYSYLKNNGALMDVKMGEGHVILFGFRPQFRGQPRGTYKLIFNSIYLGAMD